MRGMDCQIRPKCLGKTRKRVMAGLARFVDGGGDYHNSCNINYDNPLIWWNYFRRGPLVTRIWPDARMVTVTVDFIATS